MKNNFNPEITLLIPRIILLIIETFFQHDLLDLVVDSCFSERNWFWQRARKHIIVQIIFGLVS